LYGLPRLPFAHTSLKSVVDIGPIILNKSITHHGRELHGKKWEKLGETIDKNKGERLRTFGRIEQF
jgi:hypothetical protein